MPNADLPDSWLRPGSIAAARTVQQELATRVIAEDALGPVRLVGGVDTSLDRFDPENRLFAAAVALDPESLAPVAAGEAVMRAPMPYVPGFLGFREVPPLVQAWQQLVRRPDLILVDGHGASHPRGLGVASHLGVVLNVPTIGVAKSRLFGREVGELGPEPGDRTELVHEGRVLAAVLRTRRRANPLYVSIGHRVSLDTAVAWVMRTLRGYRLPEPTRQAHLAANALRRARGMHAAAE